MFLAAIDHDLTLTIIINIMKSDNIFDIWRFLGKGTPFVVRRNGWYHLSYKVTRVIPQRQYGKAYGYRLKDGKLEINNQHEELIDCCGCGNWELIENLIEDVNSLQWNCLDENNNLTFGKYKSMNAEELKVKDKDYYEWAWGYIGGFSELIFIRRYGVTLQDLFTIKKQIKESLHFSADDWIKSSVKTNYDFVLDQYKYACCAKQKDIITAVKEIEEYYNQRKSII